MIFVSGTKRSGTSMWMQILQAAGLPILGKAFPRNWAQSLKSANPDGFYETALRQGVYYRTNPHPKTGKYFLPADVEGYAVKVFVPGVVRSERAYISHLVANIRAWREYEASINRLYAIEDEARLAKHPESEPSFRFPPAYEWWMENFALVRDISLRRYPARLQAYDRVVEAPEAVLPKVFAWIGTGDVEAALQAVKPENRTQYESKLESSGDDTVEPKLAQVFDDLYHAIREGHGLTGSLLKTLNDTNLAMLDELRDLQIKVARSQMELSRKSGGKSRPIEITGLPEV